MTIRKTPSGSMARRLATRGRGWLRRGSLLAVWFGVAIVVSTPHAVANPAAVARSREPLPAGAPLGDAGRIGARVGSTLAFVANAGQFDRRVRFAAHGAGLGVLVLSDEILLITQRGHTGEQGAMRRASRPPVVRMKLAGASPRAEIVPESPLAGRFNYLVGSDRSRWVTGVQSFARVRCHEVYPGVDLVLYGNDGRLEYDFVLSPGADPGVIAMDFQAADRVSLSTTGDLVLETPQGSMLVRRPIAFQGVADRRPVEVSYVVHGSHRVGVEVAGYDPVQPLIIDPVLEVSTFLGGSLIDAATSVATDALGNAYVAGFTESWDFPLRTNGGCHFEPSPIGVDCRNAFVAKLDPTGSLVYATFLRGSTWAEARGLGVAAGGEAVLTGATDSPDFPATVRFGSTAPKRGAPAEGVPVGSVFVTRLRASGAELAYSAILRGTGDDEVAGLALDPQGNAWIAGLTDSPDFPAVAAVQPTRRGATNAFVARLAADGSALGFSTYLGGSGQDYATSVAVDSAANGYVAGFAGSSDFPVRNAFQAAQGGAFLAKFRPAGEIVFSTRLGGAAGHDLARGVSVDAGGGACVVGTTYSLDFPMLHPVQASMRGGGDAFVTRFTPAGDALLFSTLLGGSGGEDAFGVATNATGDVFVTGLTRSGDFPTVNDWGSREVADLNDMFVAKLGPSGALSFAGYVGAYGGTWYGGFGYLSLLGVAVAPGGGIWVAGSTPTAAMSVVNAAQPRYGGGISDAFVLKIHDDAPPGYAVAAAASPMHATVGVPIGFTASVTGGAAPFALEWDFGDGSPHAGASAPTHAYVAAGAYTVRLAVTDVASHVAWTALVVEVTPPPCNVACDAAAPLAATAGQAAAFVASATASSCPGLVAYLWGFGDGATSTEPTPTHAYATAGVYSWSVLASVGAVTCARSGTIAVSSAPVNASYLIPALAHKPGFFGTQWRSDVAIVNPAGSSSPANLTLVFRCAGCPPLFGTASLPAGATVEWRDILTSFFGLPDSTRTSGVLQVLSDQPVPISARSYDQTAEGTLGESYPALTANDGLTSGEMGILGGIKRNAAFRTNIGAVNLGTSQCVLVLQLYGATGQPIGTAQTIMLDGGTWQQLDDVFIASGAGSHDLAYATVEVQTQGGRAWAYASVIDNATGDPTTITVVTP